MKWSGDCKGFRRAGGRILCFSKQKWRLFLHSCLLHCSGKYIQCRSSKVCCGKVLHHEIPGRFPPKVYIYQGISPTEQRQQATLVLECKWNSSLGIIWVPHIRELFGTVYLIIIVKIVIVTNGDFFTLHRFCSWFNITYMLW